MTGGARTAERGSVTILMASLLLVLGVITLGLADLARVLVADARAQGAADLAALAAAQELAVPGASTPAQLADGFARANGAIVTGCVCEAGSQEAVVTAQVSVGDLALLPGSYDASASARAVVDLPAAVP